MYEARLAILASGGGSTAESLFDWASIVVTNNPKSGVLERVARYNQGSQRLQPLNCIILPRKPHTFYTPNGEVDIERTQPTYGEALLRILKGFEIDFVSQNGWLVRTPKNIIEEYEDRIFNTHPAPLDCGYDDFGGQGMHGLAPHAAVLKYRQSLGRSFPCTTVAIHHITEEHDKGGVVAHKNVKIEREDTPETLQERVKAKEIELLREFWPPVLETGIVPKPYQRQYRLYCSERERLLLIAAKEEAIKQYSHH